jgi:hypothetical protein
MQLFSYAKNKNSILGNLYTNKSCKWIDEIEVNDIQPFIIQKALCMNDRLRVQTRWLDKYVFTLPAKMYLSLAWSIIPKTEKEPFIRYIRQAKDDVEFDFLIKRIRKHLNLSDNDWASNSERLMKDIKENMTDWFCYYGIEKKYWKKYKLPFAKMKTFGVKVKAPPKGLSAWGL